MSTSALTKARVAFTTNATSSSHAARNAFVGSPSLSSNNWKLKQLHGAYQLLTNHADELVKSLSAGADQTRVVAHPHQPSVYYQELAVAIYDIEQHYTDVSQRLGRASRTGSDKEVKEEVVPVGVSLLLFDTANPIRFLFSTLAANIALGNTVVLANLVSGQDGPKTFWGILRSKLPQYLDPETFIILEEALEPAPGVLDMADLTTIIAEQPDTYRGLLDRPKTQFISTTATSIIVVDDGPKSYEQVASDIHTSFTFRGLRPESVNVCFIRERELPNFQKAFSTLNFSQNNTSAEADKRLEDFPRLCSGVHSTQLSLLLGPAKKHDVRAAFDVAERSGALLVLSYRSIDQVIEALNTLQEAPKYITFLAPGTKEVGDYFQKWTNSEFFSLGHTRHAFPYGKMFADKAFGAQAVLTRVLRCLFTNFTSHSALWKNPYLGAGPWGEFTSVLRGRPQVHAQTRRSTPRSAESDLGILWRRIKRPVEVEIKFDVFKA
ncbi:hypothetical protein F66182_9453 [Fusarium sp. NRRL 66182]|nr:hypothetical protein F66182_9453 [Fusarium sp. NRRL 66182]